MEKIEHTEKTLTEKIEKIGSKKPEIITVNDAKKLREHVETCTEPGCPYKPLFPEIKPKTQEPTQKEPEKPKETPKKKRWSVSDLGRES